MKNLLLILLLPILFTACNSETEEKAVNEIVKVYGGNIGSSTGFNSSTDKGSIKYFKIEIDNPVFYEEGTDREGIAGGAALLLYNNLSEEERNKYNQYDITFKNGMNEEYFQYSGTLMQEIHTQEKIAKDYLRELTEGKYENVSNNYIEEKRKPTDSTAMIFLPFEQQYGQLKEISNVSFKKVDYITKMNEKIPAMEFMGSLVKQDGMLQYSITLNPSLKQSNILILKGGIVPKESSN
jgi:hypothetical protein